MQSVNGLSLAPDVKNWLVTTRHPRILHIFDRACNLINEYGDVLSIVTTQIGEGPFNLVVENDICFSEHLRLESEVSISPTQLHLGDLTIHTADAKLWNPQPDWQKLHARKVAITNQLTQLRITNYPNLRGFDTLFREHTGPRNHQGFLIPQSLVSNLSLALVNADISSARKITSQLSGLGIGLTPSGDDYIMGAIYAAWIIHPYAVASVLAKEIADTAAPRTTSLSAAWLRSAGRGETGILWHRFFDALMVSRTLAPHASAGVGNPTYSTGIQEAMEKILAVGETSGADALAGFTGVFASWMNKVGSSHG